MLRSVSEKKKVKEELKYMELDEIGRNRLNELEKYLDVKDILFFRSLAENQLHLEKAQNRLYENMYIRETPHSERAISNTLLGWVSWATGYNPEEVKFNDAEFRMSWEEQDALLELLDFDQATIFSIRHNTDV